MSTVYENCYVIDNYLQIKVLNGRKRVSYDENTSGKFPRPKFSSTSYRLVKSESSIDHHSLTSFKSVEVMNDQSRHTTKTNKAVERRNAPQTVPAKWIYHS